MPGFSGVPDADDVGVRMGPAAWRDKALPTLGEPVYNSPAPIKVTVAFTEPAHSIPP